MSDEPIRDFHDFDTPEERAAYYREILTRLLAMAFAESSVLCAIIDPGTPDSHWTCDRRQRAFETAAHVHDLIGKISIGLMPSDSLKRGDADRRHG